MEEVKKDSRFGYCPAVLGPDSARKTVGLDVIESQVHLQKNSESNCRIGECRHVMIPVSADREGGNACLRRGATVNGGAESAKPFQGWTHANGPLPFGQDGM